MNEIEVLKSMWVDNNYNPDFKKKIDLDLSSIEPSLAGPKRPQDKILLKNIPQEFKKIDNKAFNNNNKFLVCIGDIIILDLTSAFGIPGIILIKSNINSAWEKPIIGRFT